MDPISAIFVMAVLGGLFAKGVDAATDGLLSAEVGGGVRGAGGYAVRAGRARWRLANAKAREIRMQSSQGRKVQEILDLAGMFVRVLSAEAVRFGSGARSGWRTGRDQARSARTERRGDAPWPVTEWARERLVRLQEARTKTPNGDPNGADEQPNEQPEQEADDLGPLPPKCPDCGMPLVISSLSDHRMGRDRCHYADMDDDPDDPNGDPNVRGIDLQDPKASGVLSAFDWDDDAAGDAVMDRARDYEALIPEVLLREAGRCPYQTAYGHKGVTSVEFCGRPSKPGNPYGHCARHEQEGLDDYDDGYWTAANRIDPNGDPNVPLPSTVPDANGNVKCGCCARLHKPLPPGEHCPGCHIHDGPNAPRDTIPNAPATKGPNVTDINSAPAAIAAWEGIGDRWESLQSRADALHAEQDALTNEVHGLYVDVATLADGMGDFAIGGEADTSAAVGELADSATSAREQASNLTTSITSAKESVDSYVAALHADFDPSIEAAAGQVADAHAVMQEA